MELIYNPMVESYLDDLPGDLPAATYDALDYLATFYPAAQLPDTRPLINSEATWETRTQASIAGRRYTIRVFVRIHSPDVGVVTIVGDKDQWDSAKGDFYEVYLDYSEQIYTVMSKELP